MKDLINESSKKELRFEARDLQTVLRESCNMWKLLNDFQNSGLECAEVLGWTHKDAASCQASIVSSARKYNIPHIKAKTIGGKIYLINTILVKSIKA